VKEENRVSDRRYHTETVTLETGTKDLAKILEQLETTLDYDDGAYSGTLTLDHTSIHTEASGYASKSHTLTATRTIGPLDRNDMSYVPATTVKDGRTLTLSNVEWQIIGTDLVGDVLTPSSYQAVATYSGKGYSKVATGYVTSADYTGEIVRNDMESVTYHLTYLGTEAGGTGTVPARSGISLPSQFLPYTLGVLVLGVVVTLAVMLVRTRREVRRLQEEEPEERFEHEEEQT